MYMHVHCTCTHVDVPICTKCTCTCTCTIWERERGSLLGYTIVYNVYKCTCGCVYLHIHNYTCTMYGTAISCLMEGFCLCSKFVREHYLLWIFRVGVVLNSLPVWIFDT